MVSTSPKPLLGPKVNGNGGGGYTPFVWLEQVLGYPASLLGVETIEMVWDSWRLKA